MPVTVVRVRASAVPFPSQRVNVPWPTAAWADGSPDRDVDGAALAEVVERLLSQPPELGVTRALAVVHRGRLVVEGYGPDTGADTALPSWSVAKSITHAAVGLCVADGRLDLAAPAPVPSWAGTPKAAITLQQLLEMRDGLDFNEEYVDVGVSHVVDMLFGAGAADVAGYAAGRPPAHPPGERWSYSSGTTNIVARVVGDAVGGGEAGLRAFLTERLLAPIGMSATTPHFDEAGTFVGSSFVDLTARDAVRFGLLYLRDGVWDGRRVLPAGWADHARTPTAVDPESGFGYGAHWWLWPDEPGSLAAHGYQGQYIVVVPGRDLVVVRFGITDADARPPLVDELRRVIGAFPPVEDTG